MNQIARCDWLPERARWSHLARSGLPAVSRKQNFTKSWILASFFFCEFMDHDFVSVHKHARKERGQYPAILTSHLVNNPYIWTAPGGLYNIFMAWLLSLEPLQSRQVNMADSFEWIFHLFGRHHCKSRIFERMENFQNDCCRPWTEKTFKNSCSKQLTIVNAVVSWSIVSRSDRDCPKSVFLQDKVTLFAETMMTTMKEVNRDKTKVPD